jgi:hypothetical protein
MRCETAIIASEPVCCFPVPLFSEAIIAKFTWGPSLDKRWEKGVFRLMGIAGPGLRGRRRQKFPEGECPDAGANA